MPAQFPGKQRTKPNWTFWPPTLAGFTAGPALQEGSDGVSTGSLLSGPAPKTTTQTCPPTCSESSGLGRGMRLDRRGAALRQGRDLTHPSVHLLLGFVPAGAEPLLTGDINTPLGGHLLCLHATSVLSRKPHIRLDDSAIPGRPFIQLGSREGARGHSWTSSRGLYL